MTPNRLINEKSPYLLQHAYNPVQWYPWGDDAFEKAEKENKPVFLSIGYSTCHWCHVMEKESFEDKDAAGLLNSYFVPVKVDREERPDIDGIYMTVCQILTGSGGWPLTILMTPDKKPFFAGTYFPKENRFGRTGLIDILQKINVIWQTRKEDILKSAEEITGAVKNAFVQSATGTVDESLSEKVYSALAGRFDALHGGFGNAPKFPSPHNLVFLLRYWKRANDLHALEMVAKTLTEMRKGGIFDHLSGGFHRYSTDRRWLVPHFEKMLYDQALISSACLEAFIASGNTLFRDIAEEIFEYILRDMTSSEGGFYSAEDADSEGVEGKFYLWTTTEIKKILGDDAEFFINVFNVRESGNWVDPVHGTEDGTNILHLTEEYGSLASDMNMNEDQLKEKIFSLCRRLFKEREKRVHPYKDDKILTDWNSLMISAFVAGYASCGKKEYLDAAEKAAGFILSRLSSGDRLLHRYREGEGAIDAHLDDYAFFIAALTDLYECTFDSKYLGKALELTELTIKEFADEDAGGFFFTPSGSKDLIARQKDLYDGAIPSGNSVMLLNLLRLSRFTGNVEYEGRAMKLASLVASHIASSPPGYTYASAALEFVFAGSYEIIIAAEDMNEEVKDILQELRKVYISNKVVMLVRSEDKRLFEAAPFLREYTMKDHKVTIYVCRNYQCALPVHTNDEMLRLLSS